jgi:hypothetical protein
LRPPPPLRTVRERLPSYGSSSQVNLPCQGRPAVTLRSRQGGFLRLDFGRASGAHSMVLSMARRMRDLQVSPVLRPTMRTKYAMVNVPAGLFRHRLMTERTLPFLSIPQPTQPPAAHQGLHHLLGKTLRKVMLPRRIVGIGLRLDLEMLPVGKIREPQEPETFDCKHPIAGAFLAEVTSFDPTFALVRMSAFGPSPQRAKQQVIHLAERFVDRHAPMILSPTPNQRVQTLDQFGLRRRAEVPNGLP